MKRFLLSVAAIIAAPAAAQSVAITGGKLVIGDGSAPIEQGVVLIVNGRVVAAGKSVVIPAGTRTVDATGKWVTPGLVAGFTRLGLAAVDAVEGSNDTAAGSSPFNAALDVSAGVNPDVPSIAVSRAAGITRAIVAPETGNAIFGGQGAVIDTGSDFEPITRARVFQFVEYGETGTRRAGGSRPALHAALRNALTEARDLAAGTPHDDAQLRRVDARALGAVLSGAQRLVVHAESAPDLLAALALKREFPTLNLVLVGAAEGWRVADRIAAAKVPVLASAMTDLPNNFEQIASTQSNIGRMRKAGVLVGIGMIDDSDTRQAQYSAQYAGNLVALTRVPGATGLSWDEAFAAISSRPAEAIGMGGEIGSLRAGRRGDVVIWSGDPLELSSTVDGLWIDGKQQSLVTRQTRLRDRYRDPAPVAMPKAYDR